MPVSFVNPYVPYVLGIIGPNPQSSIDKLRRNRLALNDSADGHASLLVCHKIVEKCLRREGLSPTSCGVFPENILWT